MDKNLVKKILITLGIVIAYKILTFIPLLGIDLAPLVKFFNVLAKTQSENSSYIMDIVYANRALARISVLSLGLSPYIFSCIVIQLLGKFIPFLKKDYSLPGQECREKIVKRTYTLTIILTAILAYSVSIWLENPNLFHGLTIVPSPGIMFRLTTVLSMVAAILLVLWLIKLINNYGIGNGLGILIVFQILLQYPRGISQLVQLSQNNILKSNDIVALLLLIAAAITIIWKTTTRVQKVPIKYSNSEVKSFIPLRFSWSGKLPIEIAQLLFFVPIVLQLSEVTFVYLSIYISAVLFATYFYTKVVFNPCSIESQMLKYGCQIESIPTGKTIQTYLYSIMKRNTLLIVLFLMGIIWLQTFYINLANIQYENSVFISGILLLVIIGVVYDIKCQLVSYFKMKETEELNWQIAYTAFDEIEAEIKKGFLKTKDISCVIEPLRFTWGMPIKTAVDEYRLYVPAAKLKEAVNILTLQ